MFKMRFIRKVDELGRIVLPVEIRRELGINERDSMEILTEKDIIIMRKWQKSCIFCGSEVNIDTYKEKIVCKNCTGELKRLT